MTAIFHNLATQALFNLYNQIKILCESDYIDQMFGFLINIITFD